MNQAQKADTFRRMHEARDAFLLPNPWDGGSARVLEAAGFAALATTSSGFARSLGREDGEVSLDEKLEHCRLLTSVTNIPITADFENGFASTPKEITTNFGRLIEAGVVGGSIEDWYDGETYDFDHAVERTAAAAEAAALAPFDFMLTARAEGLLRQTGDLDEIIKRLQAFEAAGADVLYAPGLKTLDEIRTVLGEISKPLNVLLPFLPGVSRDEFATIGVARLSVGGALEQRTTGAFRKMAEDLNTSEKLV